MYIRELIKEERGAALMYVLLMLLVLTIFTGSALTIFSSNLKQAKYQQDSVEAYYIAYSGVEMAFAALMADSKAKTNDLVASTDPNFKFSEDDIALGNGTVNIVASKSSDAGFEGWIKITASAVLTRNNQTYVRSMYFNPADPNETVWLGESL